MYTSQTGGEIHNKIEIYKVFLLIYFSLFKVTMIWCFTYCNTCTAIINETYCLCIHSLTVDIKNKGVNINFIVLFRRRSTSKSHYDNYVVLTSTGLWAQHSPTQPPRYYNEHFTSISLLFVHLKLYLSCLLFE